MDDLSAARSQMAMSLAFHIIFAAIARDHDSIRRLTDRDAPSSAHGAGRRSGRSPSFYNLFRDFEGQTAFAGMTSEASSRGVEAEGK